VVSTWHGILRVSGGHKKADIHTSAPKIFDVSQSAPGVQY